MIVSARMSPAPSVAAGGCEANFSSHFDRKRASCSRSRLLAGDSRRGVNGAGPGFWTYFSGECVCLWENLRRGEALRCGNPGFGLGDDDLSVRGREGRSLPGGKDMG